MNSYVLLEVKGVNYQLFIKRLYKMHINLYKIKYKNDNLYLKLSYTDYLKIKDIKSIYEIIVIKRYGYINIKYFLLKYRLILILIIIFLTIIFILSNIILDIKVESDNLKIRELVLSELKKEGIKKYSFSKGFFNNEKIINKILKNNRDTLEWMEIERYGTKYIIKVEQRKINDVQEETGYRHIVARKNALLLSIESEKGEIIKKINDYVIKDEIVISGVIMKKDEIKDFVNASGKIYGEVWYKVNVSLPIVHNEMIKTNNIAQKVVIEVFDKKIDKNKYKYKEYTSLFTIKDLLLPIKVGLFKISELNNISSIYTYDNAYLSALNIARDKLLKSLAKDSKIIDEKSLKINENNSKIDIDIFFKVKEDITNYQAIDINSYQLTEE